MQLPSLDRCSLCDAVILSVGIYNSIVVFFSFCFYTNLFSVRETASYVKDAGFCVGLRSSRHHISFSKKQEHMLMLPALRAAVFLLVINLTIS